jgi:thioredoxin-related protein
MHKIILGLLFLSSTLFSLNWVKDLDTAFAQAKKENKTVMVMVESRSCGWCTKMKNRTLKEDDVVKRLQKFVTVKVMRNDAKAMAVLPKIEGVPTVFFMNANRKVIEELVGYVNVRRFNAYLDRVEEIVKVNMTK